jgi:multiple sugar transport system ATP-binding protein
LFQVECKGVSKRYPDAAALAVADLDLGVERGERFVIVGPSGSGKTSLVRMIAGLESPSSGEICIAGKSMQGVPARDRGVAMVFQNQVLYPHLSVFENLAFGLRARRVPERDVVERIESVAGWLGLSAHLDRRPSSLSGGERQRVAIGRAVATRPAVLLLDEPFSGLDTPLRSATRETLLDVHRQLGGTLILVTHDQTEALAIGDRIAVMNAGRIEQVGDPRDLYDRPANRFVAGFLGEPAMNFLPARQSDGGVIIESTDSAISHVLPRLTIPARLDSAWLGVRPEAISIRPSTGSEFLDDPPMFATLERVERMGHEIIARLRFAGHPLWCRADPGPTGSIGDRVEVGFDPACVSWFSRTDHSRLINDPVSKC